MREKQTIFRDPAAKRKPLNKQGFLGAAFFLLLGIWMEKVREENGQFLLNGRGQERRDEDRETPAA